MNNFWTEEPDDNLYQHIGQLVLDVQFRAWVLQPTPESEAYWIDYLNVGLPEREEAVRQARLVVLALKMPDHPVSPAVIEAKTDQLLRRIRTGSSQPEMHSSPVRSLWSRSAWQWAAAALVVLSMGWWVYHRYMLTTLPIFTYNQDITSIPLTGSSGTVVEESTLDQPRRVTLPDGSTVALQPHSRLRYDKVFRQPMRTVTLTGQAFFVVTHNPQKPFLVFTDDVVTRVLGTSFTVTTRQGQPVVVSVRTGQVAVYTRQAFAQASQRPTDASHALLLTPNQQATLDKTAGALTKKLVAEPLPVSTQPTATLNFENRPVLDVIDELETMYGVHITCNRERLSQCRVTVLLENESLFDQLTLLCKLIDGRYEIAGTTVSLIADGCL